MNAIDVLCAQLTRDLFAIAKFLLEHSVVFHSKRYDNIPTGTSLTGVSHAGGMKNRIFRPISRLISEMIQDRAIVTVDANRDSIMMY